MGKLINDLDYKDAILGALKDKEYYAKFKYALANEIILKWYEDRAAGGNVIFATNLKQWKQEIDDEYNELVQKKKDIYGSQYQFYLKNEEYITAFGVGLYGKIDITLEKHGYYYPLELKTNHSLNSGVHSKYVGQVGAYIHMMKEKYREKAGKGGIIFYSEDQKSSYV